MAARTDEGRMWHDAGGYMIIVRAATLSDVVYIDSLQRKNAEELAFYPRQVFEREVEKHRIVLALINADPVGYLYRGAFGQTCRIHQACIQYDARGYLYGSELVRHMEGLCYAANVAGISLRCGSDIAANGFWRAMGYSCVAVTPGGVRRMRDINTWHKALSPALFGHIALEPSTRQQDASIWRKRGELKLSRFARGNRLLEYRQQVVSVGSDE